MAEIFISYSQGAPEPTQTLAADLVKLKYAVWFDSRLLPGDAFWQVIEDKINAAKAVIVIWTPPALVSRGVRAEAQLAYDQNKLICTRTPDVAASQVKLPFNALEQSLVTDRDKIYAALTQLDVHPASGQAAVLPKGERDAGEAAMAWDHIKGLTDLDIFEEFFKHYGEGHPFYRRLAEKRIAELRGDSDRRVVAAPAAVAPVINPEDVVIRIAGTMHTATIRCISLTADQRLMATASDDKTVRLWSLPEGELIRTLRPAIGPGNAGKVNAVAVAPDGSWVAAGGWDAAWAASQEMYVTVFDAATGAATARLGPVGASIIDLDVSPDGRRLAAGVGSKAGVRVWELTPDYAAGTKTWRQVLGDPNYGGGVHSVCFSSRGLLAATCEDGTISVYGPDHQLRIRAKASGGEPYGSAFSPDGGRLAIGYYDTRRVDILAAETLELVCSPDVSGVDNGNLSAAGWMADGTVVAAGTYIAGNRCAIFAWADGGHGARRILPGPFNSVMDLAAWRTGLAFGAAGPMFGLIGADGEPVLLRQSPIADLRRRSSERFLVSADGTRLRFGIKDWTTDPWSFDLGTYALAPSPKAPADLREPDTTSLKIENWENRSDIRLNGNALGLWAYESSCSLAIAPDKQSFVLGTNWSLTRFDSAGTELWRRPIPGVAWGVNQARDGRLILASYGDGTIRWHRASDGEELLALFIHVPENESAPRRWVLWTPEGYYRCSPGGDDLIGWHVNRGLDRASDFYPADTFAASFNRPDMVAKALDKLDAPAA